MSEHCVLILSFDEIVSDKMYIYTIGSEWIFRSNTENTHIIFIKNNNTTNSLFKTNKFIQIYKVHRIEQETHKGNNRKLVENLLAFCNIVFLHDNFLLTLVILYNLHDNLINQENIMLILN